MKYVYDVVSQHIQVTFEHYLHEQWEWSLDKIFITPANILQKQQTESWNINITIFVVTTWRSVSSCAEPGGQTGRRRDHTVCSWMACPRCVSACVWWAHLSGQTSSHNPPTDTHRASPRCGSSGAPWGGRTWCRSSRSPRGHRCGWETCAGAPPGPRALIWLGPGTLETELTSWCLD